MPLWLQRAEDPDSCPWALSAGMGLSDELWSSVNFTRSVRPPHWRHALLKVSSDQSSSEFPISLKLCSALDLLSGLLPNQSCAFEPTCTLQWHGPLAPSHGHPQLWWGCKFLPYGQPPGLFHQGWIHCVGVKVGSNLAQHICHDVIASLLVL